MKIIYEAQDGQQFSTESNCIEYERIIAAASIEDIDRLFMEVDSNSVGEFIFNNFDYITAVIKN